MVQLTNCSDSGPMGSWEQRGEEGKGSPQCHLPGMAEVPVTGRAGGRGLDESRVSEVLSRGRATWRGTCSCREMETFP
jgi:hypothetical protein